MMPSQVAQWVKNLPIMQETQETQFQSLGQEESLEKGTVTHSSILAWKDLMYRGAWQATVPGVPKSKT